jgi:phosphohistidine swiveling domain-containing protein
VARLRASDVQTQLESIRALLEAHTGNDVCDVEFTVEDGKLYVVEARRARRSPIANLRFALQFLEEGQITLPEALRRVRPEDVHACLAPHIASEKHLQKVGTGMPVSSGAATGHALLVPSGDGASESRPPQIFVANEVSPDHLRSLFIADGILTMAGGMTSHAALISRNLGKPCVVGLGGVVEAVHGTIKLASGQTIRSNRWVTINGSTGDVFLGRAAIESPKWHTRPETEALNRILSFSVLHNLIPLDASGHCWRIWDYFVHGLPLVDRSNAKRPVEATRAIYQTPELSRNRLSAVTRLERKNTTAIVWGLHRTLSRTLSGRLGIGQHYRYFRPLWNPQERIERDDDDNRQLVGLEYFDINRYIDWLPDVARLSIRLEVQIPEGQSGCFLDRTNPLGDSVIEQGEEIRRLEIMVNKSRLFVEDWPKFYNYFRRREYTTVIYETAATDASELKDFLTRSPAAWASRPALLDLCRSLGLISGRRVTEVGMSFVGLRSWEMST